jgi:serine/threonine-protein kinase
VRTGGTLTQIGTSIGTPAYMSPEQAAAGSGDGPPRDIYSFGCLAYEVIAGAPPFLAKSPQKLLAAQMGETPQPVSELRPDVPAALSQLVMKCLAKDADDRPQRASGHRARAWRP